MIMPTLNLDELITVLTTERISLMVTVPAVYALLLRHKAFAGTDVSGVRWVGYGGAPIARRWCARFKMPFRKPRCSMGTA